MSALPFALRLTCWLSCLVFLISPTCTTSDNQQESLRQGDDVRTLEEGINDDIEINTDEEDEDYLDGNTTEKGKYLGSPCDSTQTCNPELQNVFCDAITGLCECKKLYPVRLGPTKGCDKPKKLGEQCYYRATCTFAVQHSTCIQVQHNAICACEEGYHRVALSRPNKKDFCAEDLVLITTDVPTLFGVATGLAVFTALICFVLKLFSRARYTRPRHYANANHAPPMLFSSDTGIPLTLHGGRPSSRTSQRSNGALTCAFTRRPSSGGSRGPLVPASRAGSRRPSLASVHSSTSSARSYSARRLERERNEKEHRQQLQELRLARQRDQQQTAPTPSPRTPHSTDELLPSVEEGKEQVPTTSGVAGTTTTTVNEVMSATPTTSTFNREMAPCTSGDIFQV